MLPVPSSTHARWSAALVVGLVAVALAVVAPLGAVHQGVELGPGSSDFASAHLREPLSLEQFARDLTHVHEGSWRPLHWISLRVDTALFGEGDARPLLRTNLLLLAATALLLAGVAGRLGSGPLGAGALATLVLVHPASLHVAATVEGRGLLLGLFAGTCGLLFHLSRRTGSSASELATLICMGIGVLATPLAALFPLAVLLLEANDQESARVPLVHRVLRSLPLVVLGIAVAALAWRLGPTSAGPLVEAGPSVADLAGGVLVDLRDAAAGLLGRGPLGPGAPTPHGLGWSGVGVPLLIVGAILATAAGFPGTRRPLLAGAFGFVAASLAGRLLLDDGPWSRPPSALLLPALVLGGLAAGALDRASGRRPSPIRATVHALALVALLLLGTGSRAHWSAWSDTPTLLRTLVERDPDDGAAQESLAAWHLSDGSPSDAVAPALHALRVSPSSLRARLLLAESSRRIGRAEAADLVEGLDPDSDDADARVGLVLSRLGETAFARPLLHRALRRDPRSGDLHAALAWIAAREGDLDTAIDHRRAALDRAPITLEGRAQLGWLLATAPEPELRDPDLAARALAPALELEPERIDLLDAMAAARAGQGRWSEAFELAGRAADRAASRGWSARERAIRDRSLGYLQHRDAVEERPSSPSDDPA